jgi:hypothetical protein
MTVTEYAELKARLAEEIKADLEAIRRRMSSERNY